LMSSSTWFQNQSLQYGEEHAVLCPLRSWGTLKECLRLGGGFGPGLWSMASNTVSTASDADPKQALRLGSVPKRWSETLRILWLVGRRPDNNGLFPGYHGGD